MGGITGKDTFRADDCDEVPDVLPTTRGSLAPVLRAPRAPRRSDAAQGIVLESVPQWLHGKIDKTDAIPAGGELSISSGGAKPKGFALLDHDGNAHATFMVSAGLVYAATPTGQFELLESPRSFHGGFQLIPSAEGFVTVRTSKEDAVLCTLNPGTLSFTPPPAFVSNGARTIVPGAAVGEDAGERAFFGEKVLASAPRPLKVFP